MAGEVTTEELIAEGIIYIDEKGGWTVGCPRSCPKTSTIHSIYMNLYIDTQHNPKIWKKMKNENSPGGGREFLVKFDLEICIESRKSRHHGHPSEQPPNTKKMCWVAVLAPLNLSC